MNLFNKDFIRIAIIGSAGRGTDRYKISSELYTKMYYNVLGLIQKISDKPEKNIIAVSGGAALSDHLSVSLYIGDRINKLKLYLPCEFDGTKFENNQTGGTANYYHNLFSKKMGKSSLQSLKKAIDKGAEVFVNHNGFKARNTQVANDCDYLIAYTFGDGDTPKDGGTLDTWNKCKTNKIHISLNTL